MPGIHKEEHRHEVCSHAATQLALLPVDPYGGRPRAVGQAVWTEMSGNSSNYYVLSTRHVPGIV